MRLIKANYIIIKQLNLMSYYRAKAKIQKINYNKKMIS